MRFRGSARSHVEDVGRTLEDVQLDIDRHQMFPGDGESLLSLDETHTEQLLELGLALTQFFARPREPVNELRLALDFGFQGLDTLHRSARLRLPRKRSGFCLDDHLCLRCNQTGWRQSEDREEPNEQSFHGWFAEYTTGTFDEPGISTL